MEEEEFDEEIEIEAITDEQMLIEMLDEAEDFDERKRIRDQLMKVQHEIRAKRGARLKQIEDERDQKLKNKVKEANERKEKTLAMYDQMAKTKASPQNADGARRDLVEEAIRARARDAELRKRRILAAYDQAAKSGPAGAPRIVDFNAFSRADVEDYTPPETKSSCTFGMAAGVSKTAKAPGSVPGTPVGNKGAPNFKQNEEHLDPMERAIRERQREAEERKKRTLAAFDIIAKTGAAGPKVVVLEEFRDLEVTPDMQKRPACDPTASFRAGVLQSAGGKR